LKLTVIKTREDLLKYSSFLARQLEDGKIIQVMSSPVQGVLSTPAQKRFYHKCLSIISTESGSSTVELDKEIKAHLLSDTHDSIDQMSVEEASAFLEQIMQFAQEQYNCYISPLRKEQ